MAAEQDAAAQTGGSHPLNRLNSYTTRWDTIADHFSSRDRSKAIMRLVRRLNDLGCQVHVTPQAA